MGEDPVGYLGDFVSQKVAQFAEIVYRFWLQKRSKFKIPLQFAPDSWTACFTVGAMPHFVGHSPQAHASSRRCRQWNWIESIYLGHVLAT